MLVTQLLRLLTHLLIGVAMAFSLKLPKLRSTTQMGIVTVVMATTQTLQWVGIILLSLVGARIETFMLVSYLLERIAIQIPIGKAFMNFHIQKVMRSSFIALPTQV